MASGWKRASNLTRDCDLLDVLRGPVLGHVWKRASNLTRDCNALPQGVRTPRARGFDPAIGFLHGVRYGRKSLALDVVEPFRQPVVDRLTLRLLNLKQLTPDDFQGGDQGLRLHPESLKRYFELYEEQLRAPSEGDGSPTWRDRLKHQVDALRDMVMAGEAAPLYQWPG